MLQKSQGSETVSLVTSSSKDACPRQHGRSSCLFCPTFRSHAASLLSHSIKHRSLAYHASSEKGKDSPFGWKECQGLVIEYDNGRYCCVSVTCLVFKFCVCAFFFFSIFVFFAYFIIFDNIQYFVYEKQWRLKLTTTLFLFFPKNVMFFSYVWKIKEGDDLSDFCLIFIFLGPGSSLKTLSYVNSFCFKISNYLLSSQQNLDTVVGENNCNAVKKQLHLGVDQTPIHYCLSFPLPVAHLSLCLLQGFSFT